MVKRITLKFTETSTAVQLVRHFSFYLMSNRRAALSKASCDQHADGLLFSPDWHYSHSEYWMSCFSLFRIASQLDFGLDTCSLSIQSICQGQHTSTWISCHWLRKHTIFCKCSLFSRKGIEHCNEIWKVTSVSPAVGLLVFVIQGSMSLSEDLNSVQLLVLSEWIFCVRITQYSARATPSKSLSRVSISSFTSAFFSNSACTSASSWASVWLSQLSKDTFTSSDREEPSKRLSRAWWIRVS